MSGREAQVVPRPDRSIVEEFATVGVATTHEAMGRSGLMSTDIRPLSPGQQVGGPAITVQVPAGDNWTVHVALEECQPGDVLVISPRSPCSDGYFGELLAISAIARGVTGLIIDAGIRDTAQLRSMGFPVWSTAISAQGTVKETLGQVNVPIVCAGALVAPGDLVVADDDGVCVVPHNQAGQILPRARAREEEEALVRERLRSGESSLDIYGLRERMFDKGVRYR